MTAIKTTKKQTRAEKKTRGHCRFLGHRRVALNLCPSTGQPLPAANSVIIFARNYRYMRLQGVANRTPPVKPEQGLLSSPRAGG